MVEKDDRREFTFLTFALNHVHEAAFLADENAHIHYVNDESCRILGYTRAELLTLRVPDIDPDFPPDRWRQHWQELKAAQTLTFEGWHRTKDGRIFPVEINANYFEYAGQGFNLGLVRDISARKRVAEEIKAMGLYNRSLIEASLDPLVAIGEDGKITDVNQATEAATGYNRAELIGTDFSMYFTDPEKAQLGYARAFREGFVRNYPLEIKGKEGKVTPVLYNATVYKDKQGKVAGLFATARDITERMLVENELRTSDERYRMAQAIGHVGNWEYNVQTTKFWGSDEAKRIYGFDPHLTDFTTEEVEKCIPERERVHQALMDLIEKGKPYRLEFEIIPRDSSQPKVIASMAELLTDENGNPLKVTGVIQDITARKNAEEKLRLTLEEAKIGTWDWDLVNDIWHASPIYYTMLGYEPKLGPGNRQEWLDRVHPDDRGYVSEAIRKAQSRNISSYQYEARILHADGSYRWQFVHGFGIKRDPDGNATWMLGIKLDITDQKNAEIALQEAEARYRALVEKVPAIIYSSALDPSSSTLYISPQVENLLGFSQKEWVENPGLWADRLHVEDRERVLNEITLCNSQGIPFHSQYRMVHRNGNIVWFRDDAILVRDEHGVPAYSSGIMLDVTDRKQIEEALLQSEANLKEAQRVGHIGSWQLDIATDVLTWSDEVYKIFEIDPRKFSASYEAFLDAIHPEDREAVDFAYTNSLKTRIPYTIEHRLRFPDGRIKYIHEHCETIYDASGAPVRSTGTIQDITERKYAEEEIRKLNQVLEQRVRDRTAQLETANKELEAFAFSVSHDLRAPLRHIDGFLELFWKNLKHPLDDQSRHYLEVISKSSQLMGTLIDDLLSFSRMGRSEMTSMPVNMGQLVKDVIQGLEPDTRDRKIEWIIGDLPIVTGDRSLLRIALVNLLANALKFTHPRPQAVIEVGTEPGPDGETIFFVRDNGVGFDMNYAGKLFGVFQRLHRADEFEGTGIGLATVRRIINRHGGRTWAEGKVNHGAKFYFSLPIND